MKSRIAWKKYFAAHPKVYSKAIPVPPCSTFEVRKENPGPYRHLLGKTLRVGYYSRQDGLSCIWIVYPDGKYKETTTHTHWNRHFRLIAVPDEVDLYGDGKPPLKPLPE